MVTLIVQENTAVASCAVMVGVNKSDHVTMMM